MYPHFLAISIALLLFGGVLIILALFVSVRLFGYGGLILGVVILIGGIVLAIKSSKERDFIPKIRKPTETKESESNFCENCGKSLKPTAKFCGKCGVKVS